MKKNATYIITLENVNNNTRVREKILANNMYEAFLYAKAYERTYLRLIGEKVETVEITKI